MRKGGLVLAFCLVILIGISWRLYLTLENGGAFLEVTSNFDAECTRVRGIMGPEDLQIDHRTGLVYISSFDRFSHSKLEGEGNQVRGGIFVYDLNDPSQGFFNLTPAGGADGTPGDFQPHGLSLYTAPDGKKTLMVVSHPAELGHTIEIFDVLEGAGGGIGSVALQHRRTVTGDALISPNDVAALDADRFYATNDHGSGNATIKMLEDYLRLDMGNLVYFDGESFSVALKGQTYANGVVVGASGDRIFVAETTDRRVSEYSMDASTGKLSRERTWFFGFGVDNLDVAPDGDIWIGGHPKMLDFIAHAGNLRIYSAGEAARIKLQDGGLIETYLVTDGSEMSGLSTAAAFEGKVVMGQVFDDGILVCE